MLVQAGRQGRRGGDGGCRTRRTHARVLFRYSLVLSLLLTLIPRAHGEENREGSFAFLGEAPGIRGHNIFAPEVVRVDEGWRCYYGGWQEAGQLNDQIYLVEAESPWAGWSAPKLQVAHGEYTLLNDPSIARGADGTWYMAYTVAFVNHNPFSFDEWIAVSTSKDGVLWSPNAGTASTKIRLSDPEKLAQGEITGMARPSLVRDGDDWRLWFDGDVDKKRAPQSFLAVAKGGKPEDFVLTHRYPPLANGFAAFWEPDVQLISPGRCLAVCQRGFTELVVGESADGIHFDLRPVLRVTDPGYPRERVSNPGLVYDPRKKRLTGLAFGMAGLTLMDHDIGFAHAPEAKD